MGISIKSLATGTALVFMMGAVAQAQKNTPLPCKDGTMSTVSGRGACSGHGGVNGEAKAAQEKASKTAKKETKKETKKAEKAEAKAEEKHETKAEEKAEQKAAKMVKCTDGTESKGGRGACSGHGGIAKAAKKGK